MTSSETRSTVLLHAESIGVEFGGVHALKGVSVEVHAGEVLALIGANGAGKSTLMKVLAGVIPASDYSGTLSLNGEPIHLSGSRQAEQMGISLVPQELLTVMDRSVLDNQFLGAEPARIGVVDTGSAHERGRAALATLGAEIDVDRPMSDLGASEQQQVQISRVLLGSPRVVLFDEPTSSLSTAESEKLMRTLARLAEQGTAVILITHRIAEAMSVAHRVSVLRDGAMVGHWRADEITPGEVVERMLGRKLSALEAERPTAPAFDPEDQPALSVSALCTPAVPGRTALNDVTFSVHPGEIVGLFGLMGAGRTELLECIFGVGAPPTSGTVASFGTTLRRHSARARIAAGMGLVTEDRRATGLALDLSVIANTVVAALRAISRFGVVNEEKERLLTEHYIRELGIRTASGTLAVRHLSGGNQQKVVMAKWLASHPKVLLLDEPGRGVDVGAKVEIFRIIEELAAKGMAVIVSSSEPSEISSLCARSLVLYRGGISAELSGADLDEQTLLSAATGVTTHSSDQSGAATK